MLFELEEPEMIKKITRVLKEETDDADEEDADIEDYVLEETVLCYPDSWNESCGRKAMDKTKVNVLIQQYYGDSWDVLRPAVELKEFSILSAEDLKALLEETMMIIEGWESEDV